MGSKVALAIADGTNMDAFVARPVSPGPGLLLLQEAFGVNAHIRDLAQRFAHEGYLVISPDLFHRTAPGFESGYDDMSQVMPHLNALTVEGLEADLRAAFLWLQNEGAKTVGAIGWCMGGRAAFLANSVLPLKAAVSFYGARINPHLLDRAKDQRGPILFFWGGKDKHISAASRRELCDALNAADKSFINVEFSAADHGFFCDARASFDAAAADEAFALTKAFLKRNLA